MRISWILLIGLLGCGKPAPPPRAPHCAEIERERDGSTEVEIPVAALPDAVRAAVMDRGRLAEAEVVLSAAGVAFEVELRGPDGKEIELMVSVDGKVIGPAPEEEDAGEDGDDKED
jgi:hypothetical protein